MHYLLFVGRIALASMFALAARGKLANRDAFTSFVASLVAFGVPRRLATRPAGALIVGAELVAAIALVGAPVAGGALAAALLAGFALGTGHVLRGGHAVRCRCFGSSSAAPVGRSELARNLVLAALALALAALAPSYPMSSLIQADAILAALVGLGLGTLITRWDDLRFLFGPARPRTPRRSSP
jgi:hypothetical protein